MDLVETRVDNSRDGAFSLCFEVEGIVNGNIAGKWAVAKSHDVSLIASDLKRQSLVFYCELL